MNSDTISVDSVCFRRNDFNLYAFLLFCVIMYLCFIVTKCRESFIQNTSDNVNSQLKREQLLNKIDTLQDELFLCETSKQRCLSDLQEKSEYIKKSQRVPTNINKNIALDRIYNPLLAPERTYPTGRLNIPGTQDFQQIGFIYSGNERYPLYGRPKYPGKTDKYEYYIIDETRNRLKIPYKSKNDNELYDGDKIHVDILNNDYDVKIYEYDQFRYNPEIF